MNEYGLSRELFSLVSFEPSIESDKYIYDLTHHSLGKFPPPKKIKKMSFSSLWPKEIDSQRGSGRVGSGPKFLEILKLISKGG